MHTMSPEKSPQRECHPRAFGETKENNEDDEKHPDLQKLSDFVQSRDGYVSAFLTIDF